MSSEPGSEGEELQLQSSGHTGAAQDFAGTRTGSLWLSRTLRRSERATGLEASGDVVEGQRVWCPQQKLKVELRRIQGGLREPPSMCSVRFSKFESRFLCRIS